VNKTIKRIQGTQVEALERGRKYRNRLTKVISKICENTASKNYQHLYVYGPAGIGKTYLVKKQLEESGVKHYLVSGANSIYTLGVFLAVLQFSNTEREKRYIFIDDCDEILKSEANCNIMKNVLFGEKKFVYENQ